MEHASSVPSDGHPGDIKNPSRYMTITYIASLSVIAILSIVVHVMLDKVISEQAKSGELINISGQQRMLSQRTSLFAMEYLVTGSLAAKQEVDNSLLKLKQNHQFLLDEHHNAVSTGKNSPLSTALLDMYFGAPVNVAEKLNTFVDSVQAALNDRVTPVSSFNSNDRVFLDMAKAPMLKAFDDVVKQYEREGKARVAELRWAQQIVLIIIVMTILAEAFFIFRPMVRRISTYATRLQYEASYDALSGLHNRRSFSSLAATFVANGHRYSQSLSVVILDIDRFKRINDTYGHDMGDKVITWIAKTIERHCRESDCVARLGGEEFAILLPNTSVEGAMQAAEKLRRKINQSQFTANGHTLAITVSGGVSTLNESDKTIDSLLKRADIALYSAKESGRNQIIQYQEQTQEPSQQ